MQSWENEHLRPLGGVTCVSSFRAFIEVLATDPGARQFRRCGFGSGLDDITRRSYRRWRIRLFAQLIEVRTPRRNHAILGSDEIVLDHLIDFLTSNQGHRNFYDRVSCRCTVRGVDEEVFLQPRPFGQRYAERAINAFRSQTKVSDPERIGLHGLDAEAFMKCQIYYFQTITPVLVGELRRLKQGFGKPEVDKSIRLLGSMSRVVEYP